MSIAQFKGLPHIITTASVGKRATNPILPPTISPQYCLSDRMESDISTSGRSGQTRSQTVRDLLRRNRCNLVFAERDRLRIEKTAEMDVLDRWQEAQWQFRRRVATTISNELVERGAAVTSLAVYLRGERRTREGWFFHDQNVVVQVNVSTSSVTTRPIFRILQNH